METYYSAELERQPVYAPSPDDAIDGMMALAALTSSDVFVDLGSGDGRVVVAVAKRFGCRAVGLELDEDRIKESRELARAEGVEHLVTFHKTDVTNVDLSKADVVYCWLEVETLARLLPRFLSMKPTARLISYKHKVPGLATCQVHSGLHWWINVPAHQEED